MSNENVQVGQLPLEPKNKEIVVTQEPSVLQLMEFAIKQVGVENGAQTVEIMERLVGLKERMEDRQAAADFISAMSEFQSECPEIPKSSKVSIKTNSGINYSYSYAQIDEIARIVRPVLHKHGFSYSWDSSVTNDKVTATCKLSHRNGHFETAKFEAPIDSAAKMNVTQRNAAALTYAKRQSLVQVLGVTTCDQDTDAQSADTITDQQAADLQAKMEEVGANKDRFLKYMKVEQLSDIRACDFGAAVNALESKRRTS